MKMAALTKEQIKEIAEQLDCGFRCFLNKQNGELIFVPDEDKHQGIEMEAWTEELKILEENFADYFEIEQLESSDSFKIKTCVGNWSLLFDVSLCLV